MSANITMTIDQLVTTILIATAVVQTAIIALLIHITTNGAARSPLVVNEAHRDTGGSLFGLLILAGIAAILLWLLTGSA